MSRPLHLPRLAAGALVLLLLGGCVYYNGMYNTKRLAGSARKAEREGRTLEANGLWGQVITRADTLVARHPDSKYVDEALVLKGIALARLKQCPDAVRPLSRGATLVGERVTAEEAGLALGRCQLDMGDPAAASVAVAPVLASEDPARRRAAHLYQARALRQLGQPEDALRVLEGLTGPGVDGERLLALGITGRETEALALADTLLVLNDSAHVWDSVVTIVGSFHPRTASALVDRVNARPKVPPDLQARRLYQDALRLEPLDSARARERMRQAAKLGSGSESGDRASLGLVRGSLSNARAMADLAQVADSLRPLASRATPAAQEAKLLLLTITRVRASHDSSGPEVAQGDLRLFVAAETARDSLAAPVLAVTLFRQVVDTWPESPYAPKAMLAARVLDPEWGEAVRPLLEEKYATSPYFAFLRGEDAEGYRALEDSLEAYIYQAAAAQRRPAPGARPITPRQPAPGVPSRTTQPKPGQRRGVEPE
jgi:hypothetical protein